MNGFRGREKRKKKAESKPAPLKAKGAAPAVLAEAVLRFQRLLAEEAPGKTGVHACKSSGTKTGDSSKGVAVEQLVHYAKGEKGLIQIDGAEESTSGG